MEKFDPNNNENIINEENAALEDEDDRDYVVFTDDDGNDFELDVIDYFFYEGQEYATLIDMNDAGCEGCDSEDCGACGDRDVYVMKLVTTDDAMEEFLPVEEDLFDAVAAYAQQRLDEGGDEEEAEDID